MPVANILILLENLIRVTAQIQAVQSLLAKAHSEGRDVTDSELETFIQADNEARAAFEAAILAAEVARKK